MMALVSGALRVLSGAFGAAGLPWMLVLVLAGVAGVKHVQVLGMRADAANLVAQAAQERVLQSERARVIEQKMGEENAKISDKLAAAVTARNVARRDVAARLRDLASAPRPSAAAEAQCRSLDAPAVAIISGAVTDSLIKLAADADAVAARLIAAQAYITNVVKPGDGGGQ